MEPYNSEFSLYSRSTLHGFQRIAFCMYLYKGCKSSVCGVDVLCVTSRVGRLGVGFQKELSDQKSVCCMKQDWPTQDAVVSLLSYGGRTGCQGSSGFHRILPPLPHVLE